MNKLIALVALSLVAATGCAVRVARPDSRPVPQQQQRPVIVADQRMSYDEAVARAIDYARARGYASDLKEAHLTGNDVWKVKLAVERPDARGKLHMEFNAYTREVIRAQEHVKFKKHKHGKGHAHGDDDDGDDRDHDDDDFKKGRGHGNAKVHGASAVAKK